LCVAFARTRALKNSCVCARKYVFTLSTSMLPATLREIYLKHAACSHTITALVCKPPPSLTFRYVALVGAAGQVILNDSVTHINTGSWALNWTVYSHTFTAPSDRLNLSFTSVTTGCACMLLDAVQTEKDCLLSPPPPPPCGGSLLTNGGFESGWQQPYATVAVGATTLTGWQVTSGSVEAGNFRSGGNCATSCAEEGNAFVQLCAGTTMGTLSQTVATVPGVTYVMSYWYDSHSTCTTGSTTSRASVMVNGASVRALESAHAAFVFFFRSALACAQHVCTRTHVRANRRSRVCLQVIVC
jgi:hypothetical protein